MTSKQFELPRLPKGLSFDVPETEDPQFRAADNVLEIFAPIGGRGVTDRSMAEALKPLAGRDVTVRINSGGGSYYQGVAIYNALAQHDGKVTVEVRGLAASAASIIAMAGDTITMCRGAELMVHRVWASTIGNAGDHGEAVAFLERLDRTAAEIYALRSGQKVERVLQMMSAETFFSASEAVKLGFADTLLDRTADPKPKAAMAGASSVTHIASAGDAAAILRRAGVPKAAASRAGSAAFKALSNQPNYGRVVARLDALAARIMKES